MLYSHPGHPGYPRHAGYCFPITLLLATHYCVTLFSNTCYKIPFSVMHEHLTIWLSAVSFLVVCLLFSH